ncbi:uncharacterized protein LOC122039778 [Zingiber officinale]|uniref:Uncharacterized protein n=1 Tax=Zingiber officinale TaxID=94328 RepID=A0A8J5HM22_ZINOF|nr:uncharacterized protein LOC122039778 [Zingiber officinale]KAG6528239.1 hypothetical protein ZIOFF_010390 [Zingiber officinale]
MAGESEMETLGSRKRKLVAVEGEEEDEREIQKLKSKVSDLARRILDARKDNLDRVLEVLSSELLAKRPALPPGALIVPDAVETGTQAPSSEPDEGGSLADQTILDRLFLLREKTKSIISATPVILKRANDCVSRIEKLENCDVKVPSVFNKR